MVEVGFATFACDGCHAGGAAWHELSTVRTVLERLTATAHRMQSRTDFALDRLGETVPRVHVGQTGPLKNTVSGTVLDMPELHPTGRSGGRPIVQTTSRLRALHLNVSVFNKYQT